MRKLIKTALCLVLAGALCLSLAGCANIFDPTDGKGSSKTPVEHIEHITIGTLQQPQDVNILSRQGSLGQLQYVGATAAPLFTFEETPKVKGYFVLDYEIFEDGKEIAAAIPTDYHWHDGSEVTFDDVKFTFEYLRDVVGFESLKNLKEVKKTADNHIVIAFSQPDAYRFLHSEAARSSVLPKAVWEKVTDPANYKGAGYDMGCGPYTVSSTGADSVELKAFPGNDYLGELRVDSITLRSFADQVSLYAALAAGEIDFVYDPDQPADTGVLDVIKEDDNIEPGQYVSLDYYAAAFDTKNLAAANAEFRKAVRLGIDWEALSKLIAGEEGHSDYTTDTSEASKVLKAAGFADADEDGRLDMPDGTPFTFLIGIADDVTEDRDILASAGGMIAKNLSKLGIDAVFMDLSGREGGGGDDGGDGETAVDYGMILSRWDAPDTVPFTCEELAGWAAGIEDAEFDTASALLQAAKSDDEYLEALELVKQMLTDKNYGFALCRTDAYYPYRTDVYEGINYETGRGAVNSSLFYKIKKK